MKLITAIIPPDLLPQVKAALYRAGVTSISTSGVSDGSDDSVANEVDDLGLAPEFDDEVRVELACPAAFATPAVQAILGAARADLVSLGKLFVRQTEEVVNLRTGRSALRR